MDLCVKALAYGEIYNHEALRKKYNVVSDNKSDCQAGAYIRPLSGST
jgi:hypothetical protein